MIDGSVGMSVRNDFKIFRLHRKTSSLKIALAFTGRKIIHIIKGHIYTVLFLFEFEEVACLVLETSIYISEERRTFKKY